MSNVNRKLNAAVTTIAASRAAGTNEYNAPAAVAAPGFPPIPSWIKTEAHIAEFLEVRQSIWDQFKPVDRFDALFLDDLTLLRWNMMRISKLKSFLVDAEVDRLVTEEPSLTEKERAALAVSIVDGREPLLVRLEKHKARQWKLSAGLFLRIRKNFPGKPEFQNEPSPKNEHPQAA